MSRRQPRSPLGDFLDGYLNEDFALIYGSAEGAAAAYCQDASDDERESVAKELETLLGGPGARTTEGVRAALDALGGAWNPASVGAVRSLLDVLKA